MIQWTESTREFPTYQVQRAEEMRINVGYAVITTDPAPFIISDLHLQIAKHNLRDAHLPSFNRVVGTQKVRSLGWCLLTGAMPSWDGRQESARHSAGETDQEIKVCFARYETTMKTPCFAFCSCVCEINGIFSGYWEICWDIQDAIANIFGEFIVSESETYDLNYHKNPCLEFNENGLWQMDTECHQWKLETDWREAKDHSQWWHLCQAGCTAEPCPDTGPCRHPTAPLLPSTWACAWVCPSPPSHCSLCPRCPALLSLWGMSSLWVPTVLSFPEPWSLTLHASYREAGDQCWCVMEVTAKHTGTCLQASMSLIPLPLSLFPSLCLSSLPSLPAFLSSPFSLFLSLSWSRHKRLHTFLGLNPTIFSGVCVCDKSGKWICLHSSLLLFISVSTSVFPSLVSLCVHMNIYN